MSGASASTRRTRHSPSSPNTYATGVWNEQVTELKYYGVRVGPLEQMKVWVREEINV